MTDHDLTSADEAFDISPLYSEREIMKAFPYFGAKELRRARQCGEIDFYDLARGPHYTLAQVQGYLERRRRPARY